MIENTIFKEGLHQDQGFNQGNTALSLDGRSRVKNTSESCMKYFFSTRSTIFTECQNSTPGLRFLRRYGTVYDGNIFCLSPIYENFISRLAMVQ